MSKTNITNNSGISLPLAVWLAMDDYDHSADESVISATTLLKPIRQICLGRKFRDNIKAQDVENLVAVSMGTALHDSVENAWKKKDKVVDILTNLGYSNCDTIYENITFEKRSIQEVGKYKISGKFDIVFAGIPADIKSTSTWTYIYGSNDGDYIKQLSIYKWLNQELITSDVGYIEYIFTDWSKSEARRNSQYPQSRVANKKLTLLSIEDTEQYVIHKLDAIAKYEVLKEEDIPYCTEEELWKEQTKWKYYKNPANTKRATKVHASEAEANAQLAKEGKGSIVEFPGKAKRCTYCNYTEVCSQYKELKYKGLVDD